MKELHSQMNLLLSRLNEQQRRWYVALEAKKLGHGGVKQMSIVTGMDSSTMRARKIGTRRFTQHQTSGESESRRWRSSKGRKKNPEIVPILLKLVQDETGGDLMSEKKWVRRTLRQLSKGLEKVGHQLGKSTIGRLLKKHDYALPQNRKEKSTRLTSRPRPSVPIY